MCWGMLWYFVRELFLVTLDIFGYVIYVWVYLGLFTGDWVCYSKCFDVVVCFCMLCSLLDILTNHL